VFEIKDGDMDGPLEVRAYEYKPVSEFKTAIAKQFYLKEDSAMLLAVKKYGEKPTILDHDTSVKNEGLYNGTKVYMTRDTDEEKFKKSVEEMDSVLTLYFALPNSKKETLEKLSIPSYEPESLDTVDSVAFNVVGECNSEDSSLSSNSDRTLVDDSNYTKTIDEDCEYFFKAVQPPPQFEVAESDEDPTDSSDSQRILKVLADRRMTVNKLKQKLQPFVKIPMEYFKIFHVLAAQTENECTQLTSTLNSAFKDEERLVIELGRALRKGEFKVKLYYLNVTELTDLEKLPFVCDYILRESAEVGQTKREIIAHIRGLDNKYAHLTYERTRLRKKSWKSPAQIYMDDQKFGDDYIIKVSASPDIIIQELPTDEANKVDFDGEALNDDSKSLFVRRFHPSKLELGKWEEIMIGSECYWCDCFRAF
jgi:ubiquitin carboxyl-terminal hydrolase 47